MIYTAKGSEFRELATRHAQLLVAVHFCLHLKAGICSTVLNLELFDTRCRFA